MTHHTRPLSRLFLAVCSLLPLGCLVETEPDVEGEIGTELRTCTPDWVIVADAEVPCHMDVDSHLLYREVEAYGVDTYEDFNGCIGTPSYDKVLMGTNKCTWTISTRQCAEELWFSLTGHWAMPDSVYDSDACPGGGGGGGGGAGPGDPPTAEF